MKALLAVVAVAALAQAEDAAPRIELADLKKAMDARAVLLLDVRGGAAYAAGHIAGAVSIPESDLEANLGRLKADKRPIVTYCA